MIKVTYYIGMNDKDTLKPEMCKRDFIKVFDELFKDYTLVEAIGKFINKNNETTEELSLIVTTFVDIAYRDKIQENCDILKLNLNQESILVEVTEPGVIFC